eukprot:GHVU01046431.1.p1 GENE.GHVU01046431.1~~GHVU01046431.1.p1  ORF type:complete len:104 (-),score=4.12 GHVU01046431.1:1729-2040(-)
MYQSRLQRMYHSHTTSFRLDKLGPGRERTESLLPPMTSDAAMKHADFPIVSVMGQMRAIENTDTSMDSDLEAFSHYPADDSVAARAVQLAAFTKYLTQLFLSY